MATNLRHQFFAIQAVVPMMRAAGGGSIINFGSISWHSLQGGMPAYTTAKAAVEGLTKGMARDLGPDKIRVNTVIPGWVMTQRQIDLWLTPEAEANLMKAQCLKEKLYRRMSRGWCCGWRPTTAGCARRNCGWWMGAGCRYTCQCEELCSRNDSGPR